MIPSDHRKILMLFILAGVVITMYDVILDSFFTVVHITFEWFELGLEELIEHLFHTNRQQSQLIVFYLMWLIALSGLYCLWRVLPSYYNRFKVQLLATCSQYKSYLISCWTEQSSIQKIKWTMSFTVSVSCLALFVFS